MAPASLILWAMTHWEEIVATLLALHGLAVAIVNLTPTPADNRWLSKAYAVVEAIAGLVTSRAHATTKNTKLKEELDAYRNRPVADSRSGTLDRM